MKQEEITHKAKQCPYYGCAGTMVCTYYSWTSPCTYPKCDKEDLWTGLSTYEVHAKQIITKGGAQ